MLRRLLSFLIAISLLFAARPASAQSSGPVYIVRAGDTLSSIAARFNITVNDLMTANSITNANLLAVGQQLVIPGLEGVTGILDTEIIGFGDSFHSLVRRTQIPIELLRRLNRLVSPTEFYVGASMIVPKQENATDLTNHTTLIPGESLLEAALEAGTDAWTLSTLNDLNGTWDALPSDVLYAEGAAGASTSAQNAVGLPSTFRAVEIPYLPFKQGGTAEVIIQPASRVTLTGMLVNYPLHFLSMGDGRLAALQGVHVLLEPGIYPLELDATLPNGTKQSFAQMVLITQGDEPKTTVPVPPEDPTLMSSEDTQVRSIVSPVTATKYWQGKFSLPVGLPYCIRDWFGTPRSLTFNGSPYSYFHGGVDYGVCSPDHPLDIYAAAPGIVVFASLLNVRGNATIVDDGWGVYTIYAHQKEFGVTVGQQVQAGQLIGQIGATGHVTGPHLHYEMWVNGIQVNPLDWLNNTYP